MAPPSSVSTRGPPTHCELAQDVGLNQRNRAYEAAVNGYTAEERGIARANVAKAKASVDTVKAQVEDHGQGAGRGASYRIGAELGEYVSPGVPLLSLVDLTDVWLRFDLREDLVKGSEARDRFETRVPALGTGRSGPNQAIATQGEYAGWRATR